MRLISTPEQNRLKDIFKPYIVYDTKSKTGLVEDAPEEAIEALKKWKQLCKEQRELEIALMFD